MQINYLKLENFRNYSESEFSFEKPGAILHGRNGSGKTNLLEAIAYFAYGRSFTNKKDHQLISFGKDFFRLQAEFILKKKKITIAAAADKSKKIIKIEDRLVERVSELFHFIKVVYFSPVDINIPDGAPSFRRNFIDTAISQSIYDYISLLRNYNQILKQRNGLLKNEIDKSEKKIWDIQFVKSAVEVINKRTEFLQEFIPILNQFYSRITEKKERISLKYKYSFPVSDDLSGSLADHLEDIEQSEIDRQRSLCGPHLDDIEFYIDGHSARYFGSQGQLRSIAITIRLVQAKMVMDHTNDLPILMFDDVLSDLDRFRSHQIISLLHDHHQIFIATPNRQNYLDFHLPELNLELQNE